MGGISYILTEIYLERNSKISKLILCIEFKQFRDNGIVNNDQKNLYKKQKKYISSMLKTNYNTCFRIIYLKKVYFRYIIQVYRGTIVF